MTERDADRPAVARVRRSPLRGQAGSRAAVDTLILLENAPPSRQGTGMNASKARH
jgi:hypothetical protein